MNFLINIWLKVKCGDLFTPGSVCQTKRKKQMECICMYLPKKAHFGDTHMLSICLAWLLLRVLTIHLPFVWQDDFPPATGRVDSEGLLEAVLNIRAPHALSIPVQGLVLIVPVQPILWASVRAPLVGSNGGGSPWAQSWAPMSKDLWEICGKKIHDTELVHPIIGIVFGLACWAEHGGVETAHRETNMSSRRIEKKQKSNKNWEIYWGIWLDLVSRGIPKMLKTCMLVFPGKLKDKQHSWCFLHYKPQLNGLRPRRESHRASLLPQNISMHQRPHNCSILNHAREEIISLSDNRIQLSLGKYPSLSL